MEVGNVAVHLVIFLLWLDYVTFPLGLSSTPIGPSWVCRTSRRGHNNITLRAGACIVNHVISGIVMWRFYMLVEVVVIPKFSNPCY